MARPDPNSPDPNSPDPDRPPPPPDAMPPFVGLRPFDVADRSRFFGRDREIQALTRAIRSHAFTAVIGASGSGKSSLVRAGVLPGMAQAGWQFLISTPGTEPIARLARELAQLAAGDHDSLHETRRYRFNAALRASAFGLADVVRPLAPDAAGLVLVIDQFEELFRHGDEARGAAAVAMREESRAYVELLLTAAHDCGAKLRVVITMRSDYFGNCAAYTGLAEAISQSQFLVPVPARDQLEQAIRGPLAQVGAQIDDALVQRLLIDVEEEIDRLPLLEHTLRRLWEGAQGSPRRLTEADYVAVGRLAGSIDAKAEQIARGLAATAGNPAGRSALEQVMKAVTAMDERGRATRRLSNRTELVEIVRGDGGNPDRAAGQVQNVLDAFGAEDTSFLRLTRGETDLEVDIGHEALIRSWKRLAGPRLDFTSGWIAQERQDGERWHHLLERARNCDRLLPWDWLRQRRWMRGRRLNAAWAGRYGGGWDMLLAWGRRMSRKSGASLLAGLVALTAIGVWLVADATSSRKEAELQRQNVADITIGYGRSLVENARLSALMAVQVLSEQDDPRILAEAGALLADALSRPIEIQRMSLGEPVAAVAFSPDGQQVLAALARGGGLRLWRPDSPEAPALFDSGGRTIHAAAFSPDGRRIAAAAGDKILVWQADRPGPPALEIPAFEGAHAVGFSPDGASLVSGGWNGAQVAPADGSGPVTELAAGRAAEVICWIINGTEAKMVPESADADCIALPQQVLAAGFSPDGASIATAGQDGSVRLSRPDGTALPMLFQMPGKWGTGFAASPWDRSTFVFTDRARIEYNPPAWSLAFSPGGDRLATGSVDNVVRLWSLAPPANPSLPRRPEIEFFGHTGPVTSVAFSPDGRSLLSASLDGTARVWTVQGAGRTMILRGHAEGVSAAAFAPGGDRVVTASDDGSVRIWQLQQQAPVEIHRHEGEVRSLAFSPAGDSVLAASIDDTASITALPAPAADRATTRLSPGGGDVNGAVFDRDGTRLALALDDNKVVVLPASGGPALTEMHSPEAGNFAVAAAFSPDGTRLATAWTNGNVYIWPADRGTGEPEIILKGSADYLWSVAYSPDGRHVLASSWDGTAHVWAADGKGPDSTLGGPRGHEGRVLAAVFSPDGRTIATGSDDKTVRIWADGQDDPLVLRGHSDQVSGLAFSGDGARLVSSSLDGTIRVWEPVSGKQVGPTLFAGGSLPVVAVSGDGRWIVTGSTDGRVQLWPGGAALATTKENLRRAALLCPLDDAELRALHMPTPGKPPGQSPELALACR